MARETAQFSTMTEGTVEDWQVIAREFKGYCGSLYERVLDHMRILKGEHGGFPIDRLEHSLQTATMAHRDERDEEYVVCALLHDIGDILCPSSHPDIAAAMLYPYVSEQNHWMVKHHGIFQGYYFFHFAGMDRDMRDASAHAGSGAADFRDGHQCDRILRHIGQVNADNVAFADTPENQCISQLVGPLVQLTETDFPIEELQCDVIASLICMCLDVTAEWRVVVGRRFDADFVVYSLPGVGCALFIHAFPRFMFPRIERAGKPVH